MNFLNYFLGIFLLLATLRALHASKMCYLSKTCIHNGIEKCGIDSQKNVRRFLDSCDILEYNCLKETDYKKTTMERCVSLPPLDGHIRSEVSLLKAESSESE